MTDSGILATRFGRPLPPGGTIGVCAPSGPYYNASDLLRPKEWWEHKGYTVRMTDGVWSKDDYVAGAPEQRAADLHDLFTDPDVDVIQVLWGGTGAIQVLPHLDYDLIAEHPKALMGFSDITNLHIALRGRAGLATFHGPGFGSMGIAERTAFTLDSALEAFAKGGVGPVPDDPEDPYRRTIAPGRVTAPIVGGQPVHVRPPARHALRTDVRGRDPAVGGGPRARLRHRGPSGAAATGGQARGPGRGRRR